MKKSRPKLTVSDPLITSAMHAAGVEPGTDEWFEVQRWGKKILSQRNAWSINCHREKAMLRGVFS